MSAEHSHEAEFEPINPQFSDVYNWTMVPAGNSLVISIPIPEGFDGTKIKAELNATHDAISCRIEGSKQPPIVEGKLFEKIESITCEKSQSEPIVNLTIQRTAENYNSEKENTIPEMPIVDKHPETKFMDPLSSFLCFNERSHGPQEQQKGCFSYLEFGLNVNFVPALLTAASIFQRIPQLADQSFHLIKIAADMYNSPPANLQMGLFLLNSPEKDLAMEYLDKAADDKADLPFAKALLGAILSPISDMESPKKDAKRAVQLFQQVITKETEPNPLALHEYAMLLYNGIGIEKDVEKAKELNEKCKQIEPNAPELEERDETYKPKPHEHCHCGCCHEHEAEEHHHCGCGHCGGHGGCGCGGHCDGHGGCGHCDGHGGCGGHCHCEHN